MRIGYDCLPRRGKDVPRCRHQPAPLRRSEEKHNVNETGKHPASDTPKVPVAAQAEIILAGQRHDRRHWSDFVFGGPRLVLRHLFLGQPEPFTSGQGVVTPIKLRVTADDFDAAADEQRNKEEIEKMGQTDPKRKPELQRSVHKTKQSMFDFTELCPRKTIAECKLRIANCNRLPKPENSLEGSTRQSVRQHVCLFDLWRFCQE